MFSSIFGKRRSSPVEDDIPPIPGPKPDDGFVVVDPSSGGNLYPSIPSGSYPASPFPQRPAPAVPQHKPTIDQTFHYLQGVPFTMCRELQMATNKDTIVAEVGDLLAFLTNKLHITGCEYNFSVEKSVLKEC